ncbi:uncharacterized protein LOC134535392 [Bacillus rossius redtenbacheri]|uniref:uncharacterized protein LOC134535392 n=1 Tax=Bacillus rossius redtenbacheri TaxID=93214 RepID=UPI002FDD06F5
MSFARLLSLLGGSSTLKRASDWPLAQSCESLTSESNETCPCPRRGVSLQALCGVSMASDLTTGPVVSRQGSDLCGTTGESLTSESNETCPCPRRGVSLQALCGVSMASDLTTGPVVSRQGSDLCGTTGESLTSESNETCPCPRRGVSLQALCGVSMASDLTTGPVVSRQGSDLCGTTGGECLSRHSVVCLWRVISPLDQLCLGKEVICVALQCEISPLEVRLEPGAREMLHAVRALLLAAHWHQFTALVDYSASSSLLLRRDLASIFSAAPLSPTIHGIRADAPHQALFRRLADVSRATRGVVVLICDLRTAERITSEARRLNMMDGHFVWLWVDTSSPAAPPPRQNATRGRAYRRPWRVDHDDPARRRQALEDALLRGGSPWDDASDSLPVGLLALRPRPTRLDRQLVRGAAKVLVDAVRRVATQCVEALPAPSAEEYRASCWEAPPAAYRNFSALFVRELRARIADAMAGRKSDKSLVAVFDVLNLVPEGEGDYDAAAPAAADRPPPAPDEELAWRAVGDTAGRSVRLDTIVWPGGDLVAAGPAARAKSVFRVVTALAPPFVMEGELDEDGQCLRGLPCHRVLSSDKDNLTLVFNEVETQERQEEGDEAASESPLPEPPDASRHRTSCCYGLTMDLLENLAQELEFDFHLYVVPDGAFGSRQAAGNASKWDGVVGDLVSGAAHMAFAALSVTSARSEVIDYSAPYIYSGVSFLAAPTQRSEIPLLAFLLPFSPELWIAIFTSLNITAMAVAVYEWLSPFGLNPWGRQRSKNFSIASALWVMWGLLCGHLVAFKAPKSWPNKFLINVWGGFSVIFVASYTANIAALIAGLFFHNTVGNYHDRSLLSQRVGAPRSSAADYYVHRANQHLWEHMQRFMVRDIEEGIHYLRNGTLDILIADTAILDYYRATDHGCKLQKIGDAINEDTYAVGMAKGFPLKDTISAVISKYSNNGYMDILQEKWYGALPCFKIDMDIAQPRPLGVAAVAGVFLLLGLGVVMGCLILLFEHLFYRYTLPILRHKPKGTIWRSRNIMFFSQKLYRFINCVELVSPHHAARELVHTLRQGQITSLFQKSVKRKEHEQRRRRKSKAQFFEMIQEIRRVQQEERDQPPILEEPEHEVSPEPRPSPRPRNSLLSPSLLPGRAHGLFSPRAARSPAGARRFSSDTVFAPLRAHLECPSAAVGRRLSKGASPCGSPPDASARRLDAPRPRLLHVGSAQDVAAVGARLSAAGARDSLSSSDLSSRRSRSRSPLPPLPGDREDPPRHKPRDRARSDTGKPPSRSLPRPGTRSDLNSRSRSLEAQGDDRPKKPCESIVEVSVTCCDSSPEDSPPARPARRPLLRRRSHQPRLETAEARALLAPAAEGPDEVFAVPPPPPPPSCSPREPAAPSPLARLSKDELLELWRSSETELRSLLLRAIRAKDVDDPP